MSQLITWTPDLSVGIDVIDGRTNAMSNTSACCRARLRGDRVA